MGTSNFDINDITTFWKCIPVPEQQVLINLASLSATPTQTIGVSDCYALMALYGGQPNEARMDVLLGYPGITITSETNPLCGDENGCVLLHFSFYLAQIWNCRLLGGCQVGAPLEPPCFYALTAP